MPHPAAAPPTHFDPVALRGDLFDSAEALRTVLEAFGPWLSDTRARLDAAAALNDPAQVGAIAHALRGGLAQTRAAAAVARVRELEAVCRDGADGPLNTEPCLRALNEELDALAGEIAAVLASTKAPRAQKTFPE